MHARIFMTALILTAASASVAAQSAEPREFRVWAVSCSHVPADIRRGRESMGRAIRQSEGLEEGAPGFAWDVMLDAGDLSAHQTPPGDRDGQELLRQYRALTKHRREQIYNVPGNHDAPYYDHGPGSWFKKWGDPLGENTVFSGVDAKRRPFPVKGTWERYRFVAGNVLFLMLADRNDAPTPVGRGHSDEGKAGGYPPGAVTRETFNWWKQQVLDNQDKIIVTMHHHALRDTTVASGKGEGNPRYHGSTGGAEGSSYLYFIIENDDPDDFQYTKDAHVFEGFLDAFHKEHGRGAIDFWIGGHTHVKSPDDNFGDKTISETKWGAGFLQVAALTRFHGGSTPLSRLLTFTDGSAEARAQVYLHDQSYKDNPIGWYAPAAKTFALRHKFQAPPAIKVLPPFPPEAKVFDEPYVAPPKHSRLNKAKPSPDLTASWKKEQNGPLHLEELLQADTDNKIDSKPELTAKSPSGTGHSAEFDGNQRIRVGPIDMEDWTDLSVGGWINTTRNASGLRVVSKDRLGEPGNFVLLQSANEVWTFRVWDDQAQAFATASWRSETLSDGKWHHLMGVVDSKQKKVLLYADGALKSEAPWTAETLDDSDAADLVVGTDSGEEVFGQTFRGLIHDVRLHSRALSSEEVRAVFDEQSTETNTKAE